MLCDHTCCFLWTFLELNCCCVIWISPSLICLGRRVSYLSLYSRHSRWVPRVCPAQTQTSRLWQTAGHSCTLVIYRPECRQRAVCARALSRHLGCLSLIWRHLTRKMSTKASMREGERKRTGEWESVRVCERVCVRERERKKEREQVRVWEIEERAREKDRARGKEQDRKRVIERGNECVCVSVCVCVCACHMWPRKESTKVTDTCECKRHTKIHTSGVKKTSALCSIP